MNASQLSESFDRKVRLHAYDRFIQTGQSPTAADTARALASTAPEVQAAYRRLAEARALVLQDNGEILMAPPFSAVPTPFVVESETHTWWANCIWDGLGVPVVLQADARIITSCGCCRDAMTLGVQHGRLINDSGVAHFRLRAKEWWKNVVFT